jgi:hypothetical protein
VCDDGGFELLEDAFTAAYGVFDNGATSVAIVHAVYDDSSGLWYEVPNGITIEMDASNWNWDYENDKDQD